MFINQQVKQQRVNKFKVADKANQNQAPGSPPKPAAAQPKNIQPTGVRTNFKFF